MKYPVHKSILFYTLCSNNSQPQSAITTRFFDGVEEFENVGGAFDIDAYKHTIFFTTSHSL
jgi:predicted secreted Zn-dependent protease